ncbi:Serine/threonine-protein kinase [Melia azedarach]|uniref:Serine/threonine-protein kinase n=1 Tax=Melia azedarach TaxID=155640 RepID=A0ACC1XMU1_MELAZ|nr:Serine/threonine-protein kinase [Melia azedarach]
MVSTSQKSLQSLLATNLKRLTITPPSASSSSSDFDFSEVFGPLTPHHLQNQSPSSTSSTPAFLGDPQVIHNRSHSFVGPSPRYALSSSLPLQIEEFEPENDAEFASEDEGRVEIKIGPADFEILRVVGQGAFGKVFQKNHVDYMKAERDILTKVTHPFIVQLRYSFQTKSKLYLILDFINGGHLFFHLYRQGIFSEDQARFYTAEIVTAVSHLHMCGIVHRDLKPENILMDADGHVMLTDFGLAKEIDESSRSNSMCGTTEYMAPEILLSRGHNKDADWWSVGILLYEMLTGQPPFTHANRQKLQQRIINEKVKLPPYLTSEAHSLLKGLLQKDPSRRLGSGPIGGDEIKHHKWFRSINWKKLEAREMLPKFQPDVSGKLLYSQFRQVLDDNASR